MRHLSTWEYILVLGLSTIFPATFASFILSKSRLARIPASSKSPLPINSIILPKVVAAIPCVFPTDADTDNDTAPPLSLSLSPSLSPFSPSLINISAMPSKQSATSGVIVRSSPCGFAYAWTNDVKLIGSGLIPVCPSACNLIINFNIPSARLALSIPPPLTVAVFFHALRTVLKLVVQGDISALPSFCNSLILSKTSSAFWAYPYSLT
mmetsp:Transcript_24637/g.37656  ORF Transcript_24637/g.37656 Transcript_24637/m.37656 type:complete len:209 (+) Transcript_24637:1820-2446(+)